MNANEYQELAGRTLIDAPGFELTQEEAAITDSTLRLVAAVGSVADLVKKGVYHRHGLNKERLNLAIAEVQHALAALIAPVPLPVMLGADDVMLVWNALGLAGESGEVVSLIRSMALDPIILEGDEELCKELGDSQWYIAAICSKRRLLLGSVMGANIEKLKKRYPEGYSSEASIQRVDLNTEAVVS